MLATTVWCTRLSRCSASGDSDSSAMHRMWVCVVVDVLICFLARRTREEKRRKGEEDDEKGRKACIQAQHVPGWLVWGRGTCKTREAPQQAAVCTAASPRGTSAGLDAQKRAEKSDAPTYTDHGYLSTPNVCDATAHTSSTIMHMPHTTLNNNMHVQRCTPVAACVLPLQHVGRLGTDIHARGVAGEGPSPQLVRNLLGGRLHVGGWAPPGRTQVVVQVLALKKVWEDGTVTMRMHCTQYTHLVQLANGIHARRGLGCVLGWHPLPLCQANGRHGW